jgi:membrane dipeptidase
MSESLNDADFRTHMLGNSLSTIRILARLGVRYLTLTHVCHSAFAGSAGAGAGTDGSALRGKMGGNGLTAFGRELVAELNRLGVIVDISHVSDETMHDVLDISRAPIAFTHSGARGVHDHPRNVPDDVLARIGTGLGQNDGIM